MANSLPCEAAQAERWIVPFNADQVITRALSLSVHASVADPLTLQVGGMVKRQNIAIPVLGDAANTGPGK